MMEHENSRLIGELIGEMRGVRQEIKHLNDTVAASVDSTHQRFAIHEKEIRDIKSAKTIALAHVKGGAFTIAIILLVFVNGAYDVVMKILGILHGIKL